MPITHLNYYRCNRCRTIATSAHQYRRAELCCNMCRTYMQFMFQEPITTPEQRKLADMGVVWNPGQVVEHMAEEGEGRR